MCTSSATISPSLLTVSCLEGFVLPSLEESLRIVTIDFDYRSQAPVIQSISITHSSNSSLSLAVSMAESGGLLICSAYLTRLQFQLQSLDSLRFSGVTIPISQKTVLVELSPLLPASTYDIYCTSVSSNSVPMSLETVVAAKLIGSTQCCSNLFVTLSRASFPSSQDQASAVTISLDSKAPLPSNLTVTLLARASASSLSSSTFSPSTTSFVDSSFVRSKAVAYIRSLPGKYSLDVRLSGASSAQYRIVYPNGKTFTILTAAESPDAPICQQAVFSDSGNSIIFTFDIPTNRGLLSQNFQCSVLLSSLSSSSKCLWINDQSFSMFTNSDSDPTVGATITLRANRLKATCLSVQSDCSLWSANKEQMVTVQRPNKLTPPLVQIVAPSLIGPCTNFPVDLTGSGGTGGRSWKSLSATSSSTSLNISDLQKFLSHLSAANVTKPFQIPMAFLTVNSAYTLSFVLCNFMGSCAQLTHQFVVSEMNSIPMVRLNSKSFRSMSTRSLLTISGDAYVLNCDGTRSIGSLQYTWTVRQQGLLVNAPSSSVNPKVFLLPPYSLSVGQLYTVSLVVSSLTSLQSAESSVSVYIEAGAIHAVIQGSSALGLPVDGYQVIDASSSYDEDRSGVFAVAAGLSFIFSCTQIEPFYQTPCSLLVRNTSPSSLNVSVPASGNGTAYLGAVFQISLFLSDKTGLRSDTTSVQITISAPSSPRISLSSLSGRKVNPQSKLKLIGSISGNLPCVAQWTVDDPTLSLPSIAQSPTTREVFLSNQRPVSEVGLVLTPSSLPEQSLLSFSLRCRTKAGLSSSSSIEVVTNSPPTPGIFSVDPTDGLSFETVFTLSAVKWEDVDLPVTYEFSQDRIGSYLVLRLRLEKSYSENRLSLPQSSESFTQLRVRVFDSLNAVASAMSSVALHSQSLTSSQLKDFLSTSLSNSVGDPDSINAALAIATVGVDSVDCGGVDWCQSLNRKNCSEESFTCGECHSGFLGELGNQNTVCRPASSSVTRLRRRLSLSCDRSSDCDEDNFEYCDPALGTCQNIPKLCPRSCSGHGTCNFLSVFNFSSFIGRCSIFDDCIASCSCSSGYAGIACEKSSSDFILYQDTKHLLVESLQNVTSLENPSHDSVVGWIATLVSLSSQQFSLRSETKILIVTLLSRILAIIESDPNSYSVDDVSGLINALDISLFVQDSTLVADARSLFHQFILRDMATGQYPIQLKSAFSQFAIFSVDDFENQTGLNLPLTPFELLRRNAFPKLLVSNTSANSYKAILSQSKSPNSLLNGSVTSSLSLMFDSHPCPPDENEVADCSLSTALPRIAPDLGRSSETPERLVVRCLLGTVQNNTHRCSSGATISTMCNGSSGFITVTCPSLEEVLTCENFNPFPNVSPLFTGSVCEYHSSTETQVLCVCSFQGTDRKLQSTNQTQLTIATELTVMGKAVLGDFIATWSSADDLSAQSVAKSWKVLITLSSLGVLFVASILAAYHQDRSSIKKIETDSTLQQARLKISRRSLSRPGSESMIRSHTESLKRKKWSPMTAAIQHEFEFLEQALPVALRNEPMWNKVVHEVQTYHRYLGIIFYHSPHFSRVLRIVAVGTNILIVLFVEAVTYNITDPNDGSCETYQTPQRCLKDTSTADPSKPNCYWDDANQACHFREVAESLDRVISIAVICALVSAPMALCVQLIVVRVLSRPSKFSPSNSQSSSPSSLSPSSRVASHQSLTLETVKASSLLETYRTMTSAMRTFRESLTESEKSEFDDAWGLKLNQLPESVTTTVAHSLQWMMGIHSSTPEENLLADLSGVMKAFLRENEFFKSSTLTPFEKDRRLMLLFVKDLLPGLQGQILESKDSRQTPSLGTVSSSSKLLCWVALCLLDLGCLLYIYLFSIRQTQSRQQAWFQSFLIWIAFDIVVASTLVVLVIHIWVPMIAMKDVFKLKKKLVTDLVLFKKGTNVAAPQPSQEFNAASYLFVSTAIASQHRSLSMSPLLLQFSTPWPKRSYKVGTKNIRQGYQNGFSFVWQAGTRILIYLLRSLIVLPGSLQDCILHMISTSGLGYSMLLFVKLYHLSPFIAIAPVVFVAIILHFYFYSSSQSMRLKRREIVPEIEKSCPARASPPAEEEQELTQRSLSLSSPTGCHLASRKSSMAQGEALGIQMIRHLKLQQPLSLSEESPLERNPEEDFSSSSGSSEPIVIIRRGFSSEREIQQLQDSPSGSEKDSFDSRGAIEQIEWLSDDEEEMEWFGRSRSEVSL
jgi:hypothetical protein